MTAFAIYSFLLAMATTLVMVQARSVGLWEGLKIMFLGPSLQQETDQPQDMLVIGAGLGRTGTTSFVEALKQLGLNPYHMLEGAMESPGHAVLWEEHANTNGSKTQDILATMRRDGFNATTDFPACLLYEELMEAYPNAKVVLTVRGDGNGHSWAQSVTDTILRLPLVARRMPFCWIPKMRSVDALMNWTWHSKLKIQSQSIEELARAYDVWEDRVRRTVPAEKLLVFPPTAGWEPLCDFLSPLKESIQERCQSILESGQTYPFENQKHKIQATFFAFEVIATICEYSPILVISLILVMCFCSRPKSAGKEKTS